MDISQQRIEFWRDLLEGMIAENLFISPLDNNIGVLALSDKEDDQYILRLYHVQKEGEGGPFLPTHELEAFSFDSRYDINRFLEKLPNMSGFDLLMVMNQLPALQ